MLDENKVLALLDESRKKLRSLETIARETPDDVMAKAVLKEKINTLSAVVGEDRKRTLVDEIKKMDVSELEVIRGSLLVLEQVLISRGLTNQEEVTTNLISVIKKMRETGTSKKWN